MDDLPTSKRKIQKALLLGANVQEAMRIFISYVQEIGLDDADLIESTLFRYYQNAVVDVFNEEIEGFKWN